LPYARDCRHAAMPIVEAVWFGYFRFLAITKATSASA
jgi:hypothetical protein